MNHTKFIFIFVVLSVVDYCLLNSADVDNIDTLKNRLLLVISLNMLIILTIIIGIDNINDNDDWGEFISEFTTSYKDVNNNNENSSIDRSNNR